MLGFQTFYSINYASTVGSQKKPETIPCHRLKKTEFLETQPRESDVSLERFLIIPILDNDIYAFLFS